MCCLFSTELSKFRIHQDGIAALEKEKIDLKKKLDQQKETCLGKVFFFRSSGFVIAFIIIMICSIHW